jgi:hypothetical protein
MSDRVRQVEQLEGLRSPGRTGESEDAARCDCQDSEQVAAIEFSSRCEAQRAIKAAATTPQEQFFATTALRRNP